MSDDRPGEQGKHLEIRDLDRIREKVTLTLEPRQVVLALLGILVLMAAFFAAGFYFAGLGARDDGPREIAGALAEGAFPAEGPALAPRLVPEGIPALPARKGTVFPARASFAGEPRDALPAARAFRRPHVPVSGFTESRAVDTTMDTWPSLAMSDPGSLVSCFFPQGCRPVRPVARGPETAVIEARATPAAHRPAPEAKAPKGAPRVRAQSVPRHGGRTGEAGRAAAEAVPYTVQVRAFRDRAQAMEFAANLRAKGYSPRVVKHDGPGDAVWYRIRLGSFDGPAPAAAFADAFNRKEGEQAIPVPREAVDQSMKMDEARKGR